MEEPLAKRVSAAACAAWATVLIFALILTGSWFSVLWLTRTRPAWAECTLMGLTWDQLQVIYVWFFGAFKLIIWTAVMLALWMTLWARRLRRP